MTDPQSAEMEVLTGRMYRAALEMKQAADMTMKFADIKLIECERMEKHAFDLLQEAKTLHADVKFLYIKIKFRNLVTLVLCTIALVMSIIKISQ